MPTRDEHLDKARHNQRFYESLDINTTDFLDWVITGLFYCALHYIDAYLAINSIHPKRHFGSGQRIDCVDRMKEIREIRSHYRALYDDSRDARYGFYPAGMRRFTVAEVLQRRDYDLAMIRNHVLRLLGIT